MEDLAESIDEDEISGKWWMRVFKNINESVDSTTSQADKIRFVVQVNGLKRIKLEKWLPVGNYKTWHLVTKVPV